MAPSTDLPLLHTRRGAESHSTEDTSLDEMCASALHNYFGYSSPVPRELKPEGRTGAQNYLSQSGPHTKQQPAPKLLSLCQPFSSLYARKLVIF